MPSQGWKWKIDGPSGLSTKIKFPSLVFPRGDIYFQLSGRPEDTILIPKTYLARSEFWTKRFANEWAGQQESHIFIKHPDINSYLTVKHYCLCCEDTGTPLESRAFLLRDSDYDKRDYHWDKAMSDCPDDDCVHDVLPFHLCDLAHGWTQSSDFPALPRQRARVASIEAHKLLYTYVVGGHANFEEDIQPRDPDPWVIHVPMLLRTIADCLELARYYDLAHVIAAPLAHDIKQVKNIWESVAVMPGFYMTLGAKLRDQEIFVEALRHFVGRQCRDLDAQDIYENPDAKIIADTCPPDVEGWEGPEGWEDDRRDFTIAKYREKMRRVAFNVDDMFRKKLSEILTAPWLGSGGPHINMTVEAVGHSIISNWYTHKLLIYKDPLSTLSVYEGLVGLINETQGERLSFFGPRIRYMMSSLSSPDTNSGLNKDMAQPASRIPRFLGGFISEASKGIQSVLDTSRIQKFLDGFIAEASKGIQSVLNDQHYARKLRRPIEYFTHFTFDINDLPWDVDDP